MVEDVNYVGKLWETTHQTDNNKWFVALIIGTMLKTNEQAIDTIKLLDSNPGIPYPLHMAKDYGDISKPPATVCNRYACHGIQLGTP